MRSPIATVLLVPLLAAACGERTPVPVRSSHAISHQSAATLVLSADSLRARTERDYRLRFHTLAGNAVDLSAAAFDLFAARVGGHQQNLLEPVTVDSATEVVVRLPVAGDAMVGCSISPRQIDGRWVSHHLKSLFFCATDPAAVPTSSAALSYRLGQHLEIVPMVDPLPLLPGDQLSVQVRLDGPELAAAEVLLYWWADVAAKPALIQRTRTNEVGAVELSLTKSGHYLVTVSHTHADAGGRSVAHHASLGFALGELR